MDPFKVIIIKDANYSYISFKRKDFISISDNGLLTIRENGNLRNYIMKDQAQIDWLKGLLEEKEKEMGVVERIEEICEHILERNFGEVKEDFSFSREEVSELYSILKSDRVFDLHVDGFNIRFRLIWAPNSTLNGTTDIVATVERDSSCISYTVVDLFHTYKEGWRLRLGIDLCINLTESQALGLSVFFKTMRENNNANG